MGVLFPNITGWHYVIIHCWILKYQKRSAYSGAHGILLWVFTFVHTFLQNYFYVWITDFSEDLVTYLISRLGFDMNILASIGRLDSKSRLYSLTRPWGKALLPHLVTYKTLQPEAQMCIICPSYIYSVL